MLEYLRFQIKITKAFTLAEVLITLTIIGVIAAVTIPALIQDIQDAQLKAAFKRSYSDIGAAIQMIKNDNAGTLTSLCGYNDSTCFTNKLAAYLTHTRICTMGGSVVGNCWHDYNVQKYLNGNLGAYSAGYRDYWNSNVVDRAGMVLNNGNLVIVHNIYNLCNSNPYSLSDICGEMSVDVNGFNGPNTIGRDIFSIWITKTGILPHGIEVGGSYCSRAAGSFDSSTGCAVKVLKGQDY